MLALDGKRCSRCKQWKSFPEFRRHPRHRFGFDAACRACLSRRVDTYPLQSDRLRGARERAVKVHVMNYHGLSWAEIGRRLGFSRQRAEQLGRVGERLARKRAQLELGVGEKVGDED